MGVKLLFFVIFSAILIYSCNPKSHEAYYTRFIEQPVKNLDSNQINIPSYYDTNIKVISIIYPDTLSSFKKHDSIIDLLTPYLYQNGISSRVVNNCSADCSSALTIEKVSINLEAFWLIYQLNLLKVLKERDTNCAYGLPVIVNNYEQYSRLPHNIVSDLKNKKVDLHSFKAIKKYMLDKHLNWLCEHNIK